eukprot:8156248-Prorocentrum_lima.AAC.1
MPHVATHQGLSASSASDILVKTVVQSPPVPEAVSKSPVSGASSLGSHGRSGLSPALAVEIADLTSLLEQYAFPAPQAPLASTGAGPPPPP